MDSCTLPRISKTRNEIRYYYLFRRVKSLYTFESFPKEEWGWAMCYVNWNERKRRLHLANQTGVILVQRDLYFLAVIGRR